MIALEPFKLRFLGRVFLCSVLCSVPQYKLVCQYKLKESLVTVATTYRKFIHY